MCILVIKTKLKTTYHIFPELQKLVLPNSTTDFYSSCTYNAKHYVSVFAVCSILPGNSLLLQDKNSHPIAHEFTAKGNIYFQNKVQQIKYLVCEENCKSRKSIHSVFPILSSPVMQSSFIILFIHFIINIHFLLLEDSGKFSPPPSPF